MARQMLADMVGTDKENGKPRSARPGTAGDRLEERFSAEDEMAQIEEPTNGKVNTQLD